MTKINVTPVDKVGQVYVIDARDVFTAHKLGCAHLRLAGERTFAVEAAPSRGAIRLEVDAQGFEDGDLDFAPCLRGLT